MEEHEWNPEEPHPYTVRLETFEGPLDLLLHLIRKNELDIIDIPIALITGQYLEYMKLMKELNLDVAGDYLLMASTLLHIKSKMLLPASAEEEEEGGEDPRADLVRRLLEYQKFKEAAGELDRRPLKGRDIFVRVVPPDPQEPQEEGKLEVSLFDLLEAFRQVLARVTPESVHEVILEPITVEQRIQEILALLQQEKRSITFHTLFKEEVSRRMIVVTFLAILELVKMKQIRLYQVAPFETIRLSPV
jgi:segregation and condensation protein A